MKYIKELDSVRAIAIFVVIVHHWVSPDNLINRILHGPIGVVTFFVLSGFLTTLVLLKNAQAAKTSEQSKFKIFGTFYLRRALRIYPVYYLTVLFLLAFQSMYSSFDIFKALPYLLTFTTNFYFIKIQNWGGALAHLWSIAVQEQFYLIWPWIFLLVNKKYYLHFILAAIFVGVASQYILLGSKVYKVLPITSLDSFGLGALLSWQVYYHYDNLAKFFRTLNYFTATSFCLYFLSTFFNFNILPLRTIIAILSLWLITYIVFLKQNNNNIWILKSKALMYIGRISYGVYLFHNIIPELTNHYLKNNVNNLLPSFTKPYGTYIIFFENFAIVLLAATLSWYFIEKPLSQFKSSLKVIPLKPIAVNTSTHPSTVPRYAEQESN